MWLAEVTCAEAPPKGVQRGRLLRKEEERQGKSEDWGSREKGGLGCSQGPRSRARVQVREMFSSVSEKALGL